MIKKLQHKFVLIAMCSLILVLMIILGVINGVNFYQTNQRADELLMMLTNNDGKFPEMEKDKRLPPKPGIDFQFTEETRFQTRYFLVRTDASGNIIQADIRQIAAVSEDDAVAYGEKILAKGKEGGIIDFYKYRMVLKDGEKLIVFLDWRSQMETMLSFLVLSLGTGFIATFVVFVLVWFFSKRAIAPIAESFEKQKRFITDAGHEIKTPLSIIAANADVLELTGGKSQWIDSIRNQTMRLNQLVQDLLLLAKMEEEGEKFCFLPFSLSDVAKEIAESFYAVTTAQHKTYTISIAPDLCVCADESGIRKMLTILIDNAVKYAGDNGWINVSLKLEGKTPLFEVQNSCEAVDQMDFTRLFDRFYREDASRSRETGGYGIGLSIAQAIAQAHKTKINVRKIEDNAIAFSVVFSNLNP